MRFGSLQLGLLLVVVKLRVRCCHCGDAEDRGLATRAGCSAKGDWLLHQRI